MNAKLVLRTHINSAGMHHWSLEMAGATVVSDNRYFRTKRQLFQHLARIFVRIGAAAISISDGATEIEGLDPGLVTHIILELTDFNPFIFRPPH